MATNNFLQFCGTDSGTNLPTQSAYAADPNRPIGNQPGVASSKFNNKALRQANAIASQLAQYVSDTTGNDVLDDGNMTNLLAVISLAFKRHTPSYQRVTSNRTVYPTYIFICTSASATVGATYTNNAGTFTVLETVASGTVIRLTGSGVAPSVSGVLTKSAGTGDSTITFSGVRAPLNWKVRGVGGGGGGSGGGSGGGAGGTGGDSLFGAAGVWATCSGGFSGGQGAQGAAGGAATLGASALRGFAQQGAATFGIVASPAAQGGQGGIGGASPFGGNTGGSWAASTAANALANSGSGAGGGGCGANAVSGQGGSSGGYAEFYVPTPPAAGIAATVGAGGTAGAAGSGGGQGGVGATGGWVIEEQYQ